MSLLARADSKTTWHHVLSFNQSANNYLRNLTKGSHVYVEANFELREPEPNVDPDSPQGRRQIFLRHGEYQVSIFRGSR
jgi:single-stranded DNA-binding protein